MARSVAELLPRRFEDLDLDDVRAILAATGEERETLWLERKQQISTSSLGKACSAFANTYGGLLVVGVRDGDDEVVGIDPVSVEAQLWVKDTLRTHVLPMPPFRARWLDVRDGKGVLLVLIEESASTPHLLTRSGAIYVRNPGSSDPVPIDDQRRLLELTARGREAAERAEALARSQFELYLHEPGETRRTEALSLAATGVAANLSRALFASDTPQRISEATWGEIAPHVEYRRPRWLQGRVAVERFVQTRSISFEDGDTVGGAFASRDGGFYVYRGYAVPENLQRRQNPFIESDLRSRFENALVAGRDVLLDLGAHGDLYLSYRIEPGGRNMQFDTRQNAPWEDDMPDHIQVNRRTDFVEDLADDVFDEIARAAGLGPPAQRA